MPDGAFIFASLVNSVNDDKIAYFCKGGKKHHFSREKKNSMKHFIGKNYFFFRNEILILL